MRDMSKKYIQSENNQAIFQCEILKNIIIPVAFKLNDSGKATMEMYNIEYAIVVSQDCDLERDFEFRSDSEENNKTNKMRQIILCELRTPEEIDIRRSAEKEYIKQARHERYYLLEADEEEGLHEEMIVDFKLLFGVDSDFLYEQLSSNKVEKVTRLCSPYREHFSQRFYNYHSRIGLPERHYST